MKKQRNCEYEKKENLANENLKYLQIVYTNADCLMNKRDELMECIVSENPHIIIITKVNPKNQHYTTTQLDLMVKGYIIFTNACEQGTRGVLTLINNHLNPIENHISQIPECQEIVTVELKLSAKDKLVMMGVYQSPNSSRENDIKLNYMVRNISQMGYSHHILTIGDLNHPEIAWDKGGTVTKNL